ncbi:HAD family hydrolase [Isoptericola aurantiacus]|uniref:HAD family hydrolase n=1 Tax=Isoptericola aurantiacus TaxID=3377839 RepID=UPI00383ABB39
MTDPVPQRPTAPLPDGTVDAVLFDLGNVLVGWDPYGAFAGLDRAEVDAWMTEVDFARFNRAQDAGRSWSDAVAHLQVTRPHLAGLAEHYARRYRRTLTGPVPGAADVVDELDAGGVALYGLTNWAADTYHHAEPAAPAIGRLRDVLVSGRVGLAKPDPEIFRLAASRFDLRPQRTVFVDDTAANVEAARAVGFRAVHFTGTPALRTALADLGLPVTRPPATPQHG